LPSSAIPRPASRTHTLAHAREGSRQLRYEPGARVPARGLFVLEADLAQFSETAARWAEVHARTLLEPALG